MSKRILVVDDDQYIRELYEELLLGEGFQVESATDGEIALGKLQEGGFHLTLLDIMMPKLDGVGVLRALKEKSPKSCNIYFIHYPNIDKGKISVKKFSLFSKVFSF